jgi:hypothetical protein
MNPKSSGKTKEKEDKNSEYPEWIIIYSEHKIPIGAIAHIVTLEEEAEALERILEECPKKGQKPLTPEERRRIARQTYGLEP